MADTPDLPEKPDLTAESGPADMSSLLAAAQQMGEQLMASQAAAAETVVEGQAGGGVVKIAVTGALQFQSVTIAAEVADPNDIEMLQDLVLAALNDAMAQLGNASEGLDVGGLDLGGLDLGGLLGGGE